MFSHRCWIWRIVLVDHVQAQVLAGDTWFGNCSGQDILRVQHGMYFILTSIYEEDLVILTSMDDTVQTNTIVSTTKIVRHCHGIVVLF